MTPVADLTGGQPLLTQRAQERLVYAVVVEDADLPLVHPAKPDLLDLVRLQQVVQQDAPHPAGASEFLAPLRDALEPIRYGLLLVVPADVLKNLVC